MAWTVKDRWGNAILLTDERWQHIVDGHWELADLVAQVLDTIRLGTRKQFANDASQYRYMRIFIICHTDTHTFL
jgi:hypothetical protein